MLHFLQAWSAGPSSASLGAEGSSHSAGHLVFCQIWQPQHGAQEECAGELERQRQRWVSTPPAPTIPSSPVDSRDLRRPLACPLDVTPDQEQ